jgi:hypothetical protein
MDEQHHKDACSYGVEIAKQFITLASAGIAFVVGVATAGGSGVRAFYVSTVIVLAVSLACGLLYLMNVVGRIHSDNDYNVYSIGLRVLAALQIVAFMLGVVILALILWSSP